MSNDLFEKAIVHLEQMSDEEFAALVKKCEENPEFQFAISDEKISEGDISVKYRVLVSKIEYGSATVEADSPKEAEDKVYNADVKIDFYDAEISDVVAEPLDEHEYGQKVTERMLQLDKFNNALSGYILKERRMADLKRLTEKIVEEHDGGMDEPCIVPNDLMTEIEKLAENVLVFENEGDTDERNFVQSEKFR